MSEAFCKELFSERAMVRWMSGVTLKDRKSSQELLGRLGVEDVVDVMKRGRLLWFFVVGVVVVWSRRTQTEGGLG
jgi:hypothetical protein